MSENIEKFFLTRHSKSVQSGAEESKYKGLSHEGEELARKRAGEDLRVLVDNAPQNAVVFLVGASERPRTKSTLEIYGDELKEIYKDSSLVNVITASEIVEVLKEQTSITHAIEILRDKIGSSNGKTVIDFPLFIKQFDFGVRWGYWSNDAGKRFEDLMKKYNDDEKAAFLHWLEHAHDEGSKFPDPNSVADEYLEGLRRISDFAHNKLSNDRPVIISAVGHRWDLDVLVTKLATGDVNVDNFNKVTGGSLINEAEPITISTEGKQQTLRYRENKYVIANGSVKN